MASIIVLGTSHRVQGTPSFAGSVIDPGYAQAISTIISERSIDFVFEEASGCGPSTAQTLTESLKSVRYLDIDPHPSVRHEHGIVDAAGQPFPENISANARVEEQNQREQFWCNRIAEQEFKNGLVICGFAHTLSLVFRLRSAGFGLQYDWYLPHDRLCSHQSGEGF
jgi:hypothetical protein